jgi:HSP20 family protein
MFNPIPQNRPQGKYLANFKSEIDKLFNRFFDFDFPVPRDLFKEGTWVPRVDVSESAARITVRAEIPGCETGDIDVSLDGRILTIKGEKKQVKEEKDEALHHIERASGYFSRSLELPADVDLETADASYNRGVLTLIFKKTKAAQSRRIEIKTG